MSRFPVVIMRWFRDGNAWSYDAGVSGELLTEILERVSPLVAETGRFAYAIPLSRDRWLVGTREPDENCLDARARDRKPFILRGAILPERPGHLVARALAEQLAKVPLPAEPGPRRAGMDVAPGTRTVARPRTRRPIRSFASRLPRQASLLGAFAALVLAGIGVLIPHFVPLATRWVIVLHATAFALALATLWFSRTAIFPLSELERSEDRWDDCLLEPARERSVGAPVEEGLLAGVPANSGLAEPALLNTGTDSGEKVGSAPASLTASSRPMKTERSLFDRTTLVALDGRLSELRGPAQVAAVYNMEVPLVIDRQYFDCIATSDTAFVRGEETAADVRGTPRRFHFVRLYRREGSDLRLAFVQVTAVPQDATEART